MPLEFLPSKNRENLVGGGSFPSIEITPVALRERYREGKGRGHESVAARPMNHPWKYALEKEEEEDSFVVSFAERERENSFRWIFREELWSVWYPVWFPPLERIKNIRVRDACHSASAGFDDYATLRHATTGHNGLAAHRDGTNLNVNR